MEKEKYDITVIIPVYNNEPYIDECINSLLNQNFPSERLQIIMINDGSTDNSLEICKKFENENTLVIDKKNSGVSDTRNIGLKKALGKYILFLDSDDYLAKDSLKNLFSFFEKHQNEVDLITYPIVYNRDGKLQPHIRYENMFKEGSAVYDLEKDYNLLQTTVNVMIKNNFEKNILFDPKQNFSEDERFDTEILMEKKKIGFCKEATYFYRRHVGTANDTITNPIYSFEMITNYYEYLFKKFESNFHIPKYIQALYMNNISWRIKQDALFPYHYEKKEFSNALKRIEDLLKKIDTDVVLSLPYMSVFHQMYILKLKRKQVEFKISENGSYSITCDNYPLQEKDSITCLVNRFKIKDNYIQLDGSFLTILFELVKPEIYLYTKNKDNHEEYKKINTFISNKSYYDSDIKTNTIYGYQLNVNLKNLVEFNMFAKINNVFIPISFKFNQFTSRKIYSPKLRIAYSNKRFIITKNNFYYKIKDSLSNIITYSKKNPKILAIRFIAKTYLKNEKIWLYSDKSGILDNAYIQFQHDIKKNDGIKRFYVYNEPYSEIIKKIPENETSYLLKFKSKKHIRLFMNADKIISSFSDLQVYCPVNKGIKWYKDITHYDFIYLQHGILHANLIKMYSKEFTQIDKFVISSPFEEQNLINKYHYSNSDLIKSGMPRATLNKNEIIAKNKILYAPSWREYLIGKLSNNKRTLKTKEFLKSNYFKEIYTFLHSKKLHDFLMKNDYILEFQLHPIFKEYEQLFEIEKLPKVEFTNGNTILEEYKMFITDFSSFQFDYVSLKRPIIYFLPDKDEFKAGLHTYRELDLKYEDAFGPLCLDSNTLINEILSYVKTEFKVKEKYKNKMENFFFEIENPCEKIYNSIK